MQGNARARTWDKREVVTPTSFILNLKTIRPNLGRSVGWELMATDKILVLRFRDKLIQIEPSKIVYFEADGNYTRIVMVNKLNALICLNLGEMEKILEAQIFNSANMFRRLGRKYIINLQYIYLIDVYEQKLILSDYDHFAFQVNASKEALKDLIEHLPVAKI